eukprot:12067367-Alexandrium_andersonii.AAC.1
MHQPGGSEQCGRCSSPGKAAYTPYPHSGGYRQHAKGWRRGRCPPAACRCPRGRRSASPAGGCGRGTASSAGRP